MDIRKAKILLKGCLGKTKFRRFYTSPHALNKNKCDPEVPKESRQELLPRLFPYLPTPLLAYSFTCLLLYLPT